MSNINKGILVLGASGMLGNAITRHFVDAGNFLITGGGAIQEQYQFISEARSTKHSVRCRFR